MKRSWPALHIVVLAASGFAATALPAAEPAELYHQYCSVCHGDRGDGRSRARQGLSTPPRDFTAPGAAAALTRDHMIDVVLNGRPGTAMVGWKTRLSRDEAAGVVDYIRGTFMRGGASGHAGANESVKPPTPALEAKAPVRGHAVRGAALYNANCATCHGLEGNGEGPRAYFIFPKPRNFLAEETRSRFTPDTLFFAVKHGVKGREMPAWGTVLNDQQIADVSQYVYENFVRVR